MAALRFHIQVYIHTTSWLPVGWIAFPYPGLHSCYKLVAWRRSCVSISCITLLLQAGCLTTELRFHILHYTLDTSCLSDGWIQFPYPGFHSFKPAAWWLNYHIQGFTVALGAWWLHWLTIYRALLMLQAGCLMAALRFHIQGYTHATSWMPDSYTVLPYLLLYSCYKLGVWLHNHIQGYIHSTSGLPDSYTVTIFIVYSCYKLGVW